MVRLEPKATGGNRPVVAFGKKRRALQVGCRHTLSAKYSAAPFDFSAKGKGGVSAAIRQLHKLITEGGYEYVVTIDVKDCFGSAKKKKVEELLPLPKQVVNNVLLIQDEVNVVVKSAKTGNVMGLYSLNTSPTMTNLQAMEAARRGVSQGSSVSGMIMYWAVIGPLLSALPFANRIVLVGDDQAIPVKDKVGGCRGS